YHAAAPTYHRLLSHLRPRVLLGLTATPERTDGQSVLQWFDGRVASELRLWKALDRELLCPFHYFGIGGAPDLSAVKWSRGRYDAASLGNVYTADSLFTKRVIQEVSRRVADTSRMRALVSLAFERSWAALAAVSSDRSSRDFHPYPPG